MPHRRLQPPRHHFLRPTGRLGGLPAGLATETDVRVGPVRLASSACPWSPAAPPGERRAPPILLSVHRPTRYMHLRVGLSLRGVSASDEWGWQESAPTAP